MTRRSPYGERGLKYQHGSGRAYRWGSLSLRRAWIEIWNNEIRSSRIWSLSLRRAWIEITPCLRPCVQRAVALLTESVD